MPKDKVVRYRTTQIVTLIVNCVDSLDDEHYLLVRLALLKRIRDKEATVRVQAALGLSRLVGNEGGEDQDQQDEDESGGLLD